MLPLPRRQNARACELRIGRAVADRRRACAVSPRRIAIQPSVGEVASDVFGDGGQIAKASSDPARNDFGSKRLGDRIQARRRITIFAWTKRPSSVKWAVSALPSGAHPANLRRKLMRKVSLTLAIALLFAGSAALTADAQTSRGANNIAGAAQNFTPIEPAACRGWGPYCRPGFVRVCGRFRCWCRPCW